MLIYTFYFIKNETILWYNQVQSAFYQYNSFSELSRWNVRGSWEFKPQSFLHLVFNDFRNTQTQLGEQQIINKLSYVRQF
jgi:hypothetical protein